MNLMHNSIKNLLKLISFTMVLAFAPVSFAEELTAPEILVKEASDNMLQALTDNKAALEEDESLIYGLIEDILIPNFDFEKMSKLALGKNWRGATEEQQVRFVKEFRLLLIRTYATALLEYTGEEINMLPFRGDLSRKRVNVGLEIVQPGGPGIPMLLALYLNDDEEWKVYDVKIEGISLVTNYRSTFANEIRTNGIDKLISDLAERNAKVKA
jgi:phospholipid transport system substrate-binding protein